MSNYVYVDLESGTILNGPIVAVSWEHDFDSLSDSEIIERAEAIGHPVTVKGESA